MSDVETFDLTNCDREPIHIPGSIQPHGCLLACERLDAGVNLRWRGGVEWVVCELVRGGSTK